MLLAVVSSPKKKKKKKIIIEGRERKVRRNENEKWEINLKK